MNGVASTEQEIHTSNIVKLSSDKYVFQAIDLIYPEKNLSNSNTILIRGVLNSNVSASLRSQLTSKEQIVKFQQLSALKDMKDSLGYSLIFQFKEVEQIQEELSKIVSSLLESQSYISKIVYFDSIFFTKKSTQSSQKLKEFERREIFQWPIFIELDELHVNHNNLNYNMLLVIDQDLSLIASNNQCFQLNSFGHIMQKISNDTQHRRSNIGLFDQNMLVNIHQVQIFLKMFWMIIQKKIRKNAFFFSNSKYKGAVDSYEMEVGEILNFFVLMKKMIQFMNRSKEQIENENTKKEIELQFKFVQSKIADFQQQIKKIQNESNKNQFGEYKNMQDMLFEIKNKLEQVSQKINAFGQDLKANKDKNFKQQKQQSDKNKVDKSQNEQQKPIAEGEQKQSDKNKVDKSQKEQQKSLTDESTILIKIQKQSLTKKLSLNQNSHVNTNFEQQNIKKCLTLSLILSFNDSMRKQYNRGFMNFLNLSKWVRMRKIDYQGAQCELNLILNQSKIQFDEEVTKVVIFKKMPKKTDYEFNGQPLTNDRQIQCLKVSRREDLEEQIEQKASKSILKNNQGEILKQQNKQQGQNDPKNNQSLKMSQNGEQEVQQQTSKIQFGFQKFDFEDRKKAAGILQCFWRKGGRNGQIECVGYATAFAIAPRLIITCAHGIFDPKRQRACNVAYFIPVDGVSSEDDVYETEQYDFLKFERIGRSCSYSYRPLRQDFALLVLKRPLMLENYFNLSQISLRKGDQLQIYGYPSEGYKFSTPPVGTNYVRSDLKGAFEKYSGDKNGDYILVHTMPTKAGHSGSPIVKLSKKKGDKNILVLVVVGIHTHRGSHGTNDGLLITLDMMNSLYNWVNELRDTHYIIDKQTKFVLSSLKKNIECGQKSSTSQSQDSRIMQK